MSSQALSTPAAGVFDDLVGAHANEANGIVRKVTWIVALTLLPAAAWLTFAPLSAAVVSSGFVKVDNNRRTLQHAEGGIVRAVHVRDGQKVKAGDLLIELGDVAVSADRERLMHRLLAEQAGALRLEAEQLRKETLVWPPALLAAKDRDAALAEQLRKEEALFSDRRNALLGQSALLREQKQKIEQEKLSLAAQLARATEAMEAQRAEYDSTAKLVSEGFLPKTRLMQLQSSVSDYAAKLEEHRGDQVRAMQRTVDLDIRLRSLENEYRQQAGDQLKTALPRIQEMEQELRKASDASTRQSITAPVDGEIMGLKVTHPGTVVAPREPLADVVPVNPKLLVEARIRTDDVNRVHAGQHADVRFTAFKTKSTALVPGEVSYLAADRQLDPQNGQPYYTVQISVDAAAVTRATHGEQMHAGMPAEVYIEGGQRTPLQYLVSPITDVLQKAGRER